MRVKLRASGRQVTVPSPPAALREGGDATPVNTRRGYYDGAIAGVVSFGPKPTVMPLYVPPPKNPIWVQIPTSIKPTPLLGQQPFKKCRGCGDK